MTELLGSSPGRELCCAICSMTSFAVEVIEINIITQDLVPAYKKNHTGVGAKITQEPFHVLSHILFKYSGLFSKFNSEHIKMSLMITVCLLE